VTRGRSGKGSQWQGVARPWATKGRARKPPARADAIGQNCSRGHKQFFYFL
jgi:hypothetical protein